MGARWPARPLRKRSWAGLGPAGSAPGRRLGGFGGSWGALGGSLGHLDPPRRSPGGLGRLRGRTPGGHFGPLFVVMQKKPVKVQKSSCFIDVGCFFGPCFGLGFRLILACVACARRRSRHRQIMEILWFLWVARHRRVFGRRRQGSEISSTGARKIARKKCRQLKRARLRKRIQQAWF